MIPRDGALTSLWQDNTLPYQAKNKSVDNEYDVVIVGGGITGITTAMLLQDAGKRCLLIEAYQLGFGTTGGTTAHLNTLLDTPYTTLITNFGKEGAKQVARAATEAIRSIKDNIHRYGIDCGFEEQEAFLFACDEKQSKELDDIYQACQEVGLSVMEADQIPVPIPFVKAIRVADQAKFHPLKYVYGLASSFEEAGGVIIQQCRVTNAEERDNKVYIETNRANFEAQTLIYATHIPPGINLLHLRCAPYRSYVMAIRLKDNNYPQNLVYDMYDPYHYYRTQNIDGTDYLIAGGKDHKTGEEENTQSCFELLKSHLQKHFDIGEITNYWSSQYFEPADGLPYIGQLPGHTENVLVATGFGGNGMIYSNIAARIFKSLVLQEENEYQELFSPSRVKPVAGFAHVVEHNADVVRQFIGKLFAAEKLDVISSLERDEGRVVKFEGHVMGLYKDEDGALHAVNPTCTHMKCSVSWNSAEKSWDCPCHGARYSMDGKVLTGPARHHLEEIQVKGLMQRYKITSDWPVLSVD